MERDRIILRGGALHHNVVTIARPQIIRCGEIVYSVGFEFLVGLERDNPYRRRGNALGFGEFFEDCTYLLEVKDCLTPLLLAGGCE